MARKTEHPEAVILSASRSSRRVLRRGTSVAAPILLARLVDLERQCCAFLTFRMTVGAGPRPICLEITEPREAKAVIPDFVGS